MSGFNDLASRTGLFGRIAESGQLLDQAQVCLNGHLINWSFMEEPEDNERFCAKCGAITITNCTNCKKEIPGKPLKHGVVMISRTPPLHCIHCGKMYPWTESKIQAAIEVINEIDGLTVDQKRKLSASIEDLVYETPRSGVAVVLLKKLAKNLGAEGWMMLKKILSDIVTKGIKEQLGIAPN